MRGRKKWKKWKN